MSETDIEDAIKTAARAVIAEYIIERAVAVIAANIESRALATAIADHDRQEVAP